MNNDELNKETLLEYLKNTYPDRVQPKDIGGLLAGLYTRGYHTINELDTAIESAKSAIERFENENPPSKYGTSEDKYTADGIVNLSTLILIVGEFAIREPILKDLKKYQKYILPERNSPEQEGNRRTSKMKCKVYPSVKSFNRFVIAPSEVLVNDLPKEASDEIGQNKACKEIELSHERHLVGLDSKQAIKNINSKGYHIQETFFGFNEIEGQPPPQ